jgi:hypothetical protein
LEQELESQRHRITELDNQVWRAPVEVIGDKRKLVSEGMEIDRLKMLIEENAQAGFEYFIY